MLVYGDSREFCNFADLYGSLLSRRGQISPLDFSRAALILCGMQEQSLSDSGCDTSEATIQTNRAAQAFHGAFVGRTAGHLEQLYLLSGELEAVTPEGFALYGLFPDDYSRAAQEWANDKTPGKAFVVGVRSIGTTLSAVVAAALEDSGWSVRRCTVRPTGHPFHREALLEVRPEEEEWVIIVDEGPGLSGSSIASVAIALNHRAAKVVLMPAHDRGPGTEAGDAIRSIWAQHVVLPAQRPAVCHVRSDSDLIELSGGKWREHVYAREGEWPPTYVPFERPKYLETGAQGPVALWKFCGLVPDYDPRLDQPSGFVRLKWLKGKPLSKEDGDASVMATVYDHLERTRLRPMDALLLRSGFNRLAHTLLANLQEEFGGEAETDARAVVECAEDHLLNMSLPLAGDGRMQPWNWLLVDGKVTKVGGGLYHRDHTVVGRQPWLWDVAGAEVEWSRAFVRLPVPEIVLRFYKLAYAAFHLGQSRFCAERVAGREKARLMNRTEALVKEIRSLL